MKLEPGPRPAVPKRRRWLAAGTVVVTLCLVAALYALWLPMDPDPASQPAPLKRRRWKVWGAIVLMLGLAAGAIVLMSAERHAYIAEVALPGGSDRLRLLQVTDGRLDYEWTDPLAFLRMLPVPLPRAANRYIPPISVHLDGQSTSEGIPGIASFLFRVVDQSGRFVDPPALNGLKINFRDSNGFLYSDAMGGLRHDMWGTYAFTVSALPRRDRELTVIITEQGAEKTVELKTANPFYQPDVADWSPEPLPVVEESGGIRARLREIISHEYAAFNTPIQRAFAMVEYTPVGDGPQSIMGDFLWFEDPAGNRGQGLSPFEKVWKVTTLAHPGVDAAFPPERVHSLGAFTVPAAGEMIHFNKAIDLMGHRFTVHCLTGGGFLLNDADRWTAKLPDNQFSVPQGASDFSISSTSGSRGVAFSIYSKAPCLLIEHGTLPRDLKLLVRVSSGGEVQKQQQERSLGVNDRSFVAYELPPLPGTTDVSFELIASQGEKFEFYVEPPQKMRDAWTKMIEGIEPP